MARLACQVIVCHEWNVRLNIERSKHDGLDSMQSSCIYGQANGNRQRQPTAWSHDIRVSFHFLFRASILHFRSFGPFTMNRCFGMKRYKDFDCQFGYISLQPEISGKNYRLCWTQRKHCDGVEPYTKQTLIEISIFSMETWKHLIIFS